MNRNALCILLGMKSNDELFNLITSTFKPNLTDWDYFVNWKRVFKNIEPVEKELNLLNYLIGKEDVVTHAVNLIKEYPNVVRAFPILLACRAKSISVLVNVHEFIYSKYTFRKKIFTDDECRELAAFLINSGIGIVLSSQRISNFVDYVTGVEVGLDSNARKNRVGSLMERIVESHIYDASELLTFDYIRQAKPKDIYDKWQISIVSDKATRIVDFVIFSGGQLYFIECNFYSTPGSKQKATANEYTQIYDFYKNQGIVFIWITDGNGWLPSLRSLEEYFVKTDYLTNLGMLRDGVLLKILNKI